MGIMNINNSIDDAIRQRQVLFVLLLTAVLSSKLLSAIFAVPTLIISTAPPENCVTKVNGMNTNKCVSDGHYENQ
jgi:hypothetical protein